MNGTVRAHLAMVLGLLLSHCRGDAGDGSPCREGPCAGSCTEGASACASATRAASCRNGAWEERECPGMCLDGVCKPCLEGDSRCVDEVTSAACVDGAWTTVRCGDGDRCAAGSCLCEPGTTRCNGDARLACDGTGAWAAWPCPDALPVCVEGACAECQLGPSECLGSDASRVCGPDGRWQVQACGAGCDGTTGECQPCAVGERRCRGRDAVEVCDEAGAYHESHLCSAGEVCAQGVCVGACALAEQALAPVGCRFHVPLASYWVHSDNPVVNASTGSALVVVHVVNPGERAVRTLLRKGSETLALQTVPARGAVDFTVPAPNRNSAVSHRAPDGVLEVETDAPVHVLLELQVTQAGGEVAQSGDVAFALPDHLLATHGHEYRVITQPHRLNHLEFPDPSRRYLQPGGFLVASLSQEETQVTIRFAGNTASGEGLPAYAAEETHQGPLSPGEAIFFLSNTPDAVCDVRNDVCYGAPGDDLTGTWIRASQPIAVFNTGMSRVPFCGGCHVQSQPMEQLMPVDLWGDDYALAARHIPRPDGTFASREQWVLLTHEPDNEIQFDPPPLAGGDRRPLTEPGSFLVINNAIGDFAGREAMQVRSTRDKPFQVARYFWTGQRDALPAGEGGSTFTFERPIRFWRAGYDVRLVGDASNRLLLVVPEGRAVRLDGGLLDLPRRPGPPGHEVLELDLGRSLRRLESDAPFGLLVYGYEISESRLTPRHAYSYAGPVGFGDALGR